MSINQIITKLVEYAIGQVDMDYLTANDFADTEDRIRNIFQSLEIELKWLNDDALNWLDDTDWQYIESVVTAEVKEREEDAESNRQINRELREM
jgi:hypothetical protein